MPFPPEWEHIISRPPGCAPFPMTTDQLFYVISKGYVTFLLEDTDDIDDKNETGLLVSIGSFTTCTC